MGHWSILCVFPLCVVVSKGPVSSTPSSSSSTAPGAAGAGASPSPARQASPSLALPLAQGERGPSRLHPLSSHLIFSLFYSQTSFFFHPVIFYDTSDITIVSLGLSTHFSTKTKCVTPQHQSLIHRLFKARVSHCYSTSPVSIKGTNRNGGTDSFCH